VIGDHYDEVEAVITKIDNQIDIEYKLYYVADFGANLILYIGFFCLLAHQVNSRIVAPIRQLTKEIQNPEQQNKRANAQKVSWSSAAVQSALEMFRKMGQSNSSVSANAQETTHEDIK